MQEYLVEKGGRRRKAVRRNCEFCGSSFLVRPQWVAAGNGRYCSQSCKAKTRIHRIALKCALCGKEFKRVKSKLANSKHNIYFCSRKCKDVGQSFDGNIKEIRPSHYGEGISCYKEIARRNLERKCGCGMSFSGLLGVHHKDGDRKNYDISNLEVVCPICHTIRHMKKTKNGWVMIWSSLTPREMIPVLEEEIFGKKFTML